MPVYNHIKTMNNQDDEDVTEMFGSMFDDDIALDVVESSYGDVKVKVKCADLYYGKTVKFMPLTVWPACNSFLMILIPALWTSQENFFPQNSQKDLIKYIDQIERLSILELGAGTGKLSVVLSAYHKKMKYLDEKSEKMIQKLVTSDCRKASLDLIRENIELSRDKIDEAMIPEVVNILWQSSADLLDSSLGASFDLVLGTDVIFAKEAIGPLVFTVKHCLKQHGLCLLANHIMRINNIEDVLFEECKANGLKVEHAGYCDQECKIKLHKLTLAN